MNEWVWRNGGMILTGETWSIGRKTLYSVGGRWMNEYGAMVEWYWQGKTEVLGEKHYTTWVVDEWMSMEQWWNDYDWGKLKYWEENIYSVGGRWMNEYGAMVEWYWQWKTEVLGGKNLSQCYFFLNQSHTDWPWMESRAPSFRTYPNYTFLYILPHRQHSPPSLARPTS